MSTGHVSRREFVGATAGAAAVLGSGRSVLGANDKVRLALIGAGNRGNDVMKAFLANKEVEFVAAADVDERHATETAAKMKEARGVDAKAVKDYRELLDRKDVDAVVIATPDHWHALPAIHAVMAGKDVYCEKPVGHNVAEGKAMIAAARKYDKIMAIGTQQRSSENFQKAVETVKSGKIGKVFWIQTWNFENISPTGMGRPADTDPPPYLDYDRWLGPAPKSAYNINRCHLLFRWFFDYAGGMMSDWGVHLNDIALWALDAKGPQAVTSTGGILTTDDNRDTPDTLQVVYDFPGCTLTYSMRKGNGLEFNGHGYGILFCGTDGSLMLDRSGPRDHPRQGDPALRHQARAGRPPDPQDQPQRLEVQGQGRRHAGPRRQLPRVPQVAATAGRRHRDRPPLDQHLPPRQHRLQGRPEAVLGHRDRDVQERRRGQRPAGARGAAGV